ncbi:MAG: carbohydrate kinase family protein, partial [Isosphaeraceae bacterium]
MRIFVSGSIAYDYIMVFPGRFRDHILPDRMHVLSVSFLVDSLQRRRGGTAA